MADETEETSGNPMSALAAIGSRPGNPMTGGLTANDMSSYNFGMTPEDIALYDSYHQGPEPAPQLNQHDYYPGFTPGGAVGSSYGRITGSQPVFGGGGALVPMGILDAQDRAVQNAAFKRAKQLEDFQKQYNKPPSSKLTNLNDNLSKGYINYAANAWKSTLKKAGGNGNLARQMYNMDPEIQTTLRSYENAAKMGDSVANKIAQDDLDIKTGKFTPTPTYMAMRQKLQRALDPSDPEFKNMTNLFMGTKVERGFSDALNEVMKNDIITENNLPTDIKTDDPEYIKVVQQSRKYRTPEQQQNYAKILSENHFAGSDYHTYDKILKDVQASTGGVSKASDTKVMQKHEGADGKGDDYTDAQPETSADINTVGSVPTPYKDAERKVMNGIHGENVYKTNSKHEAVTLNIPISNEMIDVHGDKINSKSGYVKGNVSQIQNIYFNKKTGKPLTTEEVQQLQPGTSDVIMKPVAVMNVDPVRSKEGVITKQNVVLVNASEIKGKFKNPKKKAGQRDYDDLIDENQKVADAVNEKLSAAPVKEETPPEPVTEKKDWSKYKRK